MTNSGLTQYKINELKSDVDGLKKDMKSIKEEDLPNMQIDVTSLKTRINVQTTIQVGALILAIIIMKFFK